ncbi:MAG: Co2+/Mg2+ efflux protein ApaG [Gammaproteobacteria bacterium]|nr:Co2+/Mg2+ efflux protein ApaG [Gammaproteobacteria bacterium]
MGSVDDIQIKSEVEFLESQSEPENNRFVFSYTIRISNTGSENITLLSRHWIITDDNNTIEEVIGDGVIGQQPEITPGTTFIYTSGAIIKTQVGIMQGSYKMITANSIKFEAQIKPFLLAAKLKIH